MKLKKMKVNVDNSVVEHYFAEGDEVIVIQDFAVEDRGLNLFWKYCYGFRQDVDIEGIQVVGDVLLDFVEMVEVPDAIVSGDFFADHDEDVPVGVIGTAPYHDEIKEDIFEHAVSQFKEMGLDLPESIDDIKLVVRKDEDDDASYYFVPESYLAYA